MEKMKTRTCSSAQSIQTVQKGERTLPRAQKREGKPPFNRQNKEGKKSPIQSDPQNKKIVYCVTKAIRVLFVDGQWKAVTTDLSEADVRFQALEGPGFIT
ncbi:hypothetical protein CDAR_250051 [Caerostris darwini]|uniref:Uncharacterized protein n=1 Tax=Caerostris darwini TaxID=1538125 RepID=A0AAV4R5V4_9ARAC|nr:hypothetical protein CDAR_250051 [Caerostris darwini]